MYVTCEKNRAWIWIIYFRFIQLNTQRSAETFLCLTTPHCDQISHHNLEIHKQMFFSLRVIWVHLVKWFIHWFIQKLECEAWSEASLNQTFNKSGVNLWTKWTTLHGSDWYWFVHFKKIGSFANDTCPFHCTTGYSSRKRLAIRMFWEHFPPHNVSRRFYSSALRV